MSGDWTKKLTGRFIVIDGPDGAGKTTQAELLADYLRRRGLDVCQVRDPGGTAIGERLREILLDPACGEMSPTCEMLLYMASRAQLAEQVVRPALADGRCVLGDRYVSATIAYQGAAGVPARTVRRAAEIAVGRTWPDLTILLDLPSETGLARTARARRLDRMEARGVEFHREVRRIFLRQARRRPGEFAVVDADAPPQAVQQAVRRALRQWAERKNG